MRVPENISDWLCEDEIHSLEIGLGAGIIPAAIAMEDARKTVSQRKSVILQLMNDAIEESFLGEG